jgi:flagellar M-ring protein FliF
VLGAGNFRISSDVDIDFSQSKESLVKYGDSHVLSQDETVRIKGAGDQAIGIPGALSNERPDTPTTAAPPQQQQQNQANQNNQADQANPAPPPAKQASVTPSDTHKTTNYDIDKTIEFLEHPSWKLRGISIAVLVNNPTGSPLPAERLKSVDKLVTSAIGVGQNPHVTVVDLPFEAPDAPSLATAGPWWRAPWANAVGQNALLALAGLLALLGGFMPLTRRLSTVHANVAASVAAKMAALRVGVPAEPMDDDSPAMRPLPRARAEPQDVLSIEAETVQTLVAGDPARTAQVLRGWIAGDRSTLKRAG